MLHKDMKAIILLKKIAGRESQRTWLEDEPIGSRPPVVK
jgi:hypothetical protein